MHNVSEMIRLDMKDSVFKMLEAGLDVNEIISQNGKTLTMHADETNPSLANTMRAFGARRLAMNLINEIESDATNSKNVSRP